MIISAILDLKKSQNGGKNMRKIITACMVGVIIAVAIVMYMYWQEETATIMKGVLVSSQGVMGR